MKAEFFLPDVLPSGITPEDENHSMNERQLEYFRRKPIGPGKADLVGDSRSTIEGLQEGTRNIPDVARPREQETDRALELRTRDRQRKLVAKIDAALRRNRGGRIRLLRGDGRTLISSKTASNAQANRDAVSLRRKEQSRAIQEKGPSRRVTGRPGTGLTTRRRILARGQTAPGVVR